MPTYEYRCESCGDTFDIVQAFSDDPLSTCEKCGGELRKVYAPVGIVFKGSGFYKTDNRGSGSRAAAAAKPASSEGGADTGSTSSGSETTPSSGDSKSSGETKPAGAGTSATKPAAAS